MNEHGDVFFCCMPRNRGHERAPKIGAPGAGILNRKCLVGRVSRFSGPAEAPNGGHGAKKDISMLMHLTKGNYVALSKGQYKFPRAKVLRKG